MEFGGGQAAISIERAEKVGGRLFSFLGIAFEAGGNQVAVGVAPGFDAGLNMVEALGVGVGAAQAVKTVAALAEVDGVAQGASFEEVEFFEVDRRERVGRRVRVDKTARVARRVEVGRRGRVYGVARARHGGQAWIGGEDFLGQAHFEDVAGFAALDDAKRAEDGEATHGFADGAGADAESTSEPGHGAMELELAFKARVAEEIEVDGAVHDGEAEARVEKVSELGPEKLEVQFFEFHV